VIRLVLNADDLGLTASVSESIAGLLRGGHVTDTSLLACGGAFPEAVRALETAGVASVGVHLCLVGGERPVLPGAAIPSLVRGERFRNGWPSVAAAVAAGRVRARDVEAEWDAQIARTATSGLRVTHLDSQQHLHLLPTLLPVAIRLARRHGVAFVRAPGSAGTPRADVPVASRGKEGLLSLFGERARRMLATAGLPPPPAAIGLAEAGRMTLPRWKDLLGRLPEGTYEVVLHPGNADAETRGRYRWGYAWDEEAGALASPELEAAFAAAGVVTVSFAGLSA
jgi:predicted glycoside hydrolase/deacetylase ChbG (UPF0249 family)